MIEQEQEERVHSAIEERGMSMRQAQFDEPRNSAREGEWIVYDMPHGLGGTTVFSTLDAVEEWLTGTMLPGQDRR